VLVLTTLTAQRYPDKVQLYEPIEDQFRRGQDRSGRREDQFGRCEDQFGRCEDQFGRR